MSTRVRSQCRESEDFSVETGVGTPGFYFFTLSSYLFFVVMDEVTKDIQSIPV